MSRAIYAPPKIAPCSVVTLCVQYFLVPGLVRRRGAEYSFQPPSCGLKGGAFLNHGFKGN